MAVQPTIHSGTPPDVYTCIPYVCYVLFIIKATLSFCYHSTADGSACGSTYLTLTVPISFTEIVTGAQCIRVSPGIADNYRSAVGRTIGEGIAPLLE